MTTKNQRPILGASCAVFHGDKVLLVKRGKNPGKGLWSLPGGKVEFGETLQVAAEREVFEETGLKVSAAQQVGIYEIISEETHFAVVCFLAEVTHPVLQVGSDAAEVGFFDSDQIANLPLAPNILQALADARMLCGHSFNFVQSR